MSEQNPGTQGERIAKRIARAGICSRGAAEALIAEGKVRIDGKVIDTPAIKVTDANRIEVNGKPLQAKEKTRLWLFHKPHSTITTDKDPDGRTTVFDVLPKDMPRVMSVGRLDYHSEGLLLLTNDGELARYMELPATGWTRRYRVRTHRTPTEATLRALKKGVTVDGMKYEPIIAAVDREQGSNCWLTVSLTEGKNREIRNVFGHFDHPVSRLLRTAYGPFQLGNLGKGEVKEVTGKVLKNALPAKMIKKLLG